MTALLKMIGFITLNIWKVGDFLFIKLYFRVISMQLKTALRYKMWMCV